MSAAEETGVAHTSLRDLILKRYVSSSAGTHRALTEESLNAYSKAYRIYLRGWIPSPHEGSAWLDLACGQGALMQLARTLGYDSVTGVDLSEEMLASCRSRGLAVVCADVMELLSRTSDATYDVVSAFDLLEHFQKDDGFRLLQAIRRVLKPGGICLLKLPNAASPWGFMVTASDLTHEGAYTPHSLKQVTHLAGFSGCVLREVGPVPTSSVAWVRGVLWRILRTVYKGLLLIETGAPGQENVYTQVMLAKLEV